MTIKQFDCKVVHRPGVRMKHIDALSRYPVMMVEGKLLKIIAKQQDEEERLRVIKEILKTQPYEGYLIEDGLLKRVVDNNKVVVLPTSMQTEIIRKVHGNGHFAVKKMTQDIQREFYVPNLKEKLERFV